MYGWRSGGRTTREPRTADGDGVGEAQIQRRRERDILFLQWVRAASQAELEAALPSARGWREVAIRRMIAKSNHPMANTSRH